MSKEDKSETTLPSQLFESIRDLHNLVIRIDERVNHLTSDMKDIEDKISKIDDISEKSAVNASKLQKIEEIASMLENLKDNSSIDDKRLTALENSNETMVSRWQKIFQFVTQLIWALVACYLIYKLGLSEYMPP